MTFHSSVTMVDLGYKYGGEYLWRISWSLKSSNKNRFLLDNGRRVSKQESTEVGKKNERIKGNSLLISMLQCTITFLITHIHHLEITV